MEMRVKTFLPRRHAFQQVELQRAPAFGIFLMRTFSPSAIYFFLLELYFSPRSYPKLS